MKFTSILLLYLVITNCIHVESKTKSQSVWLVPVQVGRIFSAEEAKSSTSGKIHILIGGYDEKITIKMDVDNRFTCFRTFRGSSTGIYGECSLKYNSENEISEIVVTIDSFVFGVKWRTDSGEFVRIDILPEGISVRQSFLPMNWG